MLINNQCIILLFTSGIWVLRLKSIVTLAVLLTSVEMNQQMLKIINFSDSYKVTTNAFSMLLTVCWNRLTVWWIRLTVWQNCLTVWWNRLTLTNGLLTADWWWLTANWRFRPLNVKTLVYVFPCEVTSAKFAILNRTMQISRQKDSDVVSLFTQQIKRSFLKKLHFWQCFHIDPVSQNNGLCRCHVNRRHNRIIVDVVTNETAFV